MTMERRKFSSSWARYIRSNIRSCHPWRNRDLIHNISVITLGYPEA
jgi:hypothetical protein